MKNTNGRREQTHTTGEGQGNTDMRILLADDHPLFREGVKPVLNRLAKNVEVFEAQDYPSAFELARRLSDLDLALLDLNMPGMSGTDGIIRFRVSFPQIPLVVLSAADEHDDIQHLLSNGVLGFINKASPSDVILGAINLVLAGGVYIPPSMLVPGEGGELRSVELEDGTQETLTKRQVDVLRQLAKGQSNKQIARNLNVTEGTVKTHLASIFRVLKVSSRTEALLVAQKMGLGDDQ
jgi:DNA-binding NarL/FixJ family response regulator